MTVAFDPAIARRTWMTLEPIHGMTYFTPHGSPIYEAIGLTGRQHYFASRSAAMGAVSAQMVTATFFNFAPSLVASCIPSAWDVALPSAVLDARLRVVDVSLRDAAAEHIETDATKTAADLARTAALVACERVDGKALFAAHAELAWPTEPHLVLWHAQTLLREYRGDIHIALLVAEGLSGLDALITYGATGVVPLDMLKLLRGWSDDQWDVAVESLRARNILQADSITFTPHGRELRERLEACTDSHSAEPWAALGEEACKTLRASARPMSAAVIDAGWSPLRKLPPDDD